MSTLDALEAAPEEPRAIAATPWQRLAAWADANTRALLIMVIVLFLPYMLLCSALAFGVFRAVLMGGCGG